MAYGELSAVGAGSVAVWSQRLDLRRAAAASSELPGRPGSETGRRAGSAREAITRRTAVDLFIIDQRWVRKPPPLPPPPAAGRRATQTASFVTRNTAVRTSGGASMVCEAPAPAVPSHRDRQRRPEGARQAPLGIPIEAEMAGRAGEMPAVDHS